VHVSGCCCFWH